MAWHLQSMNTKWTSFLHLGVHDAVADLGGAQPARAPPPFETFFYKCPPFLYMCPPPPFWNLKKKKKRCHDSAWLYPGCYLTPGPITKNPPPLTSPQMVTLRYEKKVSEFHPPPPLISFVGTCASYLEAGGGPEIENSMLCPPLSQIPGYHAPAWCV